jgi:hypothetical protein
MLVRPPRPSAWLGLHRMLYCFPLLEIRFDRSDRGIESVFDHQGKGIVGIFRCHNSRFRGLDQYADRTGQLHPKGFCFSSGSQVVASNRPAAAHGQGEGRRLAKIKRSREPLEEAFFGAGLEIDLPQPALADGLVGLSQAGMSGSNPGPDLRGDEDGDVSRSAVHLFEDRHGIPMGEI